MIKTVPPAAWPMRTALSLARWPWPAPALLAWAAGWLGWALLGALGMPSSGALAGGWCLSMMVAWPCRGWRRKLIAAAGFPLSALALGFGLGLGAGAAAWVWLLPLLLLLAAYPLRAWRDAPFFPTAVGALEGLSAITGEPRCVLDAGCGLGHGLVELRRLWPHAELRGVEWSPVLAWLAAWRGRKRGLRAQVQRGDMWALPWRGHDLVYLFQRPESMARAWARAQAELEPGAWLVSLEFAVPGVNPHACLQGDDRRTVWIYRPVPPIKTSTDGRTGR